ncbi:MAG: hypothetical protein IKL10_07690 [Clostridia bacterium]|nr:hypothetical protein [Clostridia bacterium]
MPYINVKLTKKLTNTEENEIKCELGKAISLFPGKSESWLMCSIEGENKIWFKGDNSEESAFVEVKLFGAVDKNSADSFTAHLCQYFHESFAIDPARIYIRYQGGTDWGWNGSNF